MHDTRPFCATLYYVDLPQVYHGGRRARGRERATRATKLRVVDLCRLQEFKSHSKFWRESFLRIKRCVHFIKLLHRADNGYTQTQKHSLELIFLGRRMKQFAPSVETK